jgi:hypothetical protein
MEWQLALNIDTNDGHAVDYANDGFWESETELGGASSELGSAMTQDYKNSEVFSSGTVEQVLVVVHDEGNMLGWRRWRATGSHSSLKEYFQAANSCESDRHNGEGVHLAAETIDAETGEIDSHEPLVKNSRGSTTDLWINIKAGDGDLNRLSTAEHPPNNLGYGLGTRYDLATVDNSPCGNPTMRPQADAQLYADQHHWGSGGGIGGLIGTDHVCNDAGAASCPEGRCGGCPWTVVSGLNYDYAIFVTLS